jgi:hypothetical protein
MHVLSIERSRVQFQGAYLPYPGAQEKPLLCDNEGGKNCNMLNCIYLDKSGQADKGQQQHIFFLY